MIRYRVLRISILLLSLMLYLLSFSQNAIVSKDYNGMHTLDSITIFGIGSTAILGGGTLEWIVWLSNPMYLFAFFTSLMPLLKRFWRYNAKIRSYRLLASVFASILAGSFRIWEHILASESGSQGDILSFEPGYYLWVSAIVLLSLFVIYSHFNINNESFVEQSSVQNLIPLAGRYHSDELYFDVIVNIKEEDLIASIDSGTSEFLLEEIGENQYVFKPTEITLTFDILQKQMTFQQGGLCAVMKKNPLW